MREIVAGVLVATLLSACAKAYATEPNSGNPVHCADAFVYFHIKAKGRGDRMEAIATMVRGQFELEKAQAAGNSMNEIKAATLAFDEANHNDPNVMRLLGVECRDKQNGDPKWHDYQKRLLAKWKAKERES